MFCRRMLAWLALGLAAALPARAATPAELDWSAWQQLPVFERGRIMPLDTFAREVAEKICGRANPRLSLEGAAAGEALGGPAPAGARTILPGGAPRQFIAAELLLSWIVEPEKWEDIPFLAAEHEELRRDLLGLPLFGGDGQRLKYVSPRQVETASAFHAKLEEMGQRQQVAEKQGAEFHLQGVEEKVRSLNDAYNLFRRLTFSPSGRLDNRRDALGDLGDAIQIWSGLDSTLQQLQSFDPQGTLAALLRQANDALKKIRNLARDGQFTLANLEPALVALQRSAAGLAQECVRLGQEPPAQAPQGDDAQRRNWRSILNRLATGAADVARLAGASHTAFYDSEHALRLVPSLDPDALQAERTPGDAAQPWLGLHALLDGSASMVNAYPQAELAAVRAAYRQLAAAYTGRGNASRQAEFAAAMDRFVAAVPALGQRIEPLREKLDIRKRDAALIAATAYPPAGSTRVEVHYNQLDPFGWSWLLNFAALCCLALSLGVARKPMFWLGLGILVGGQIMTAYGFALRTYITTWAPVTGMFETVVFVGLVVAMLGVWFTLLPLVRPGLRSSWRLTAAPFTWEAGPALGAATAGNHGRRPTGGAALLACRLGLTAVIFYVLALRPYGLGQTSVIHLWPRISVGSSWPSLMELTAWLAGLCVLAPAVWYLPRVAISAGLSLGMIPYCLVREGPGRPWEQVLGRKPFAVAAALAAFLVAMIAYYSPLWNKQIEPLTPALRDRFWLYIHVLTITSSYGAGALAWGLGLDSLAHYLFGRYRDPVVDPREAAAHGEVFPEKALVRRAPTACAGLGTFIYKAIQVAVLLLAAGTILGALWADVAWGRFWGWDPGSLGPDLAVGVPGLPPRPLRRLDWQLRPGRRHGGRRHRDHHGLVRRELSARHGPAFLRLRRRRTTGGGHLRGGQLDLHARGRGPLSPGDARAGRAQRWHAGALGRAFKSSAGNARSRMEHEPSLTLVRLHRHWSC
jgi:hypothetical protein